MVVRVYSRANFFLLNMETTQQNSFDFKAILAKAGIDGFLLMLAVVIILAYFFPSIGIAKEPISLEQIANYGLTLIFFFYGLRLNPKSLYADLKNWRMHIIIQMTTFVVFPVIVLLTKPLVSDEATKLLWLGVFYLATLPSTVSSSVVMVANAGGNIPSAIFNASVSSILGIFITPLWMSLFLSSSAENFDMSGIVLKLFLQVLLPVILGLLLHSYFGSFAEKHKKKLRYFDQTVILLIIYTSFCHSFADGIFQQISLLDIFLLSILMIGLFFLVYFLVNLVCKLMGFNLKDKITVLFCSSKKSLVHGTVMSKVLFPQATAAGVIILPIMLYHAFQLIFVSILAQRFARQTENLVADE